VTPEERARFDALMDEAVAALPPSVHEWLEEIPVVVLDMPTPEMLRDLGFDPEDPEISYELCGLHSGVPLTERSVEEGVELPSEIHVFRQGIIAEAGGWSGADADDRVYDEIMITLLHEIGHHFGLDEDDLAALGYE